MLIFRYNKLNEAAFIPHLDSLRAIIRTLRRAGIVVGYSHGYSPHMNINMSPPLPLGTESVSEYCAVETEIRAEEFMERYNACCIKGMECISAFKVTRNPNIAATAHSALYEIKSLFLRDNFEDITKRKEFIVTFDKNGIITQKDALSDVLSYEKRECGVAAVLNFGNNGNLRIDRFLHSLGVPKCDVVKRELFCKSVGGVVRADEYISLFKAE